MDRTVAKGIFDALELLRIRAVEGMEDNDDELTKVRIAHSVVHTALGVVTDYVPFPIISFKEKSVDNESEGDDDGV